MARPTDCTDDVTIEIAGALELGLSIADACALGGIAESTYHDWVDRGKAGESPFAEFSELTREARANGRRYHARIIRQAAPDDWRAASFFLERSDPDQWGRSEKVKAEASGEITVKVVYIRKSSDTAGAALGPADDSERGPAIQRRELWAALRQVPDGDPSVGNNGA